MSRTAKLAVAAAFGGLLLAIAMTSAKRSPSGSTAVADLPLKTVLVAPSVNELKRCRTLVDPDAACDAAWDLRRRRFFREDEKP